MNTPTALLSSSDRRTRAVTSEVVASTVNALARETDLPIATAAELRRIFLLERVALETLCVQVDGSAHHTKAGDPGTPDRDAEVIDAVEEDAPLTDSDTDTVDEDAPEIAGTGNKAYTYLGDGVSAAVDAGLVVPMSHPFRLSKYTVPMWRYVRLTATGRALADKYIGAEVRQRGARGLPELDKEVDEALAAGTLKKNIRAR